MPTLSVEIYQSLSDAMVARCKATGEPLRHFVSRALSDARGWITRRCSRSRPRGRWCRGSIKAGSPSGSSGITVISASAPSRGSMARWSPSMGISIRSIPTVGSPCRRMPHPCPLPASPISIRCAGSISEEFDSLRRPLTAPARQAAPLGQSVLRRPPRRAFRADPYPRRLQDSGRHAAGRRRRRIRPNSRWPMCPARSSDSGRRLMPAASMSPAGICIS